MKQSNSNLEPSTLNLKPVCLALCALCALCLLLSVSAAEPREPKWAPDWKEGLAEAVERKCPVIVVAPYKRGTHRPCIFPTVFNDADVIMLSGRFVCFLADDARFSGVDTVYAAKFVKPQFGKYGSPQVVFCKSDGTEVESLRLKGTVSKGKVIANMNRMLASYLSVIPKSQYDSCKRLADRAELMRALGAYTQAIESCKKLAKKKVNIQLVKDAPEKLNGLRKEAAQKVEEAAGDFSEGGPEEKERALEKLHIYFRSMKRLEVHGKVKDLLAKAKKDRALRAAYNRAQKVGRAFELFLKAETLLLKGNYKKALKTYKRIVRSYDETEYYDRAKKRIEEIVKKLTARKATTP